MPEEAIGSDQGKKIVYVVDEQNKVVSRTVTLGAKHDALRIIEEGLKPDDRVIIEGRAHAGQTVKPSVVKP